MHRVVLRAEQSLLFGRDRQEQDRPLRRRRQLRERARDLEQCRPSRRHCHRAVVDAVAVDRRADAEMIPVRRVDDVLVLQLRIAALELRDDVLRVDRAQRVAGCVIDAVTPSGTGLKSRVAACFFSVVEVLAGHLQQDLAALIERDPSFDRGAAHVLVGRHEIELLASCRSTARRRTDSRPARSRG